MSCGKGPTSNYWNSTPEPVKGWAQESQHVPDNIVQILLELSDLVLWPGEPVPVPKQSLCEKKLFLVYNLTIPWHSLMLFPQALSLVTREKRSVPIPLLPLGKEIRLWWSLPSACSSPAWTDQETSAAPFTIFVWSLLWSLPNSFMSLLYCGA